MNKIKGGSQVNYSNIDICKMICSLLIVAIHTRPFISFSEELDFVVVDIIARIGVPFFYAATAFFFFRKVSFSTDGKLIGCRENNQRLKVYIKRIFKLYLVWSIIYLIWQIPYWYSIDWWGQALVIDYLVSFLMRGSVYHFWYFVSLIYGVIILYGLLRRFGIKKTVFLSIFFYAVKCLVYGYFWIDFPMMDTLEKIWNMFSGVCDGIGLALPFMMVGVLASQETSFYAWISKHRKLGFMVSVIGLVIEATLLFHFDVSDGKYSYIIFTLPVCLFFFANVIESKEFIKEKRDTTKYRKYSTLVFCIHPFIIYLCQLSETFNGYNSLLKYFLIVIVSMLMSVILEKIDV